MIRCNRILAGLAALAIVGPLSATVFAASDDKVLQPPEDCKVHEPVTANCHVHDERTYQHMRMQDRDKMSPHAQHEMREHMRKAQQEKRD